MYGKVVPVRIAIDKNNNLTECPIEFEVVQEFSTNGGMVGRDEKITLGKVTLNLSEYVEESEGIIRDTGFRTRTRMPSSSAAATAAAAAAATAAAGGGQSQGHARKRSSLSTHVPFNAGEEASPTTVRPSSRDQDSSSINSGNNNASRAPSINEPALQPPAQLQQPEQYVEDGVIRRYLMQDSRVNSTLKIGILMVQLDGERNFSAPALKTAPVFGGIAGMVGEANADAAASTSASILIPPHHHHDPAAAAAAAEFGSHHQLQDADGQQDNLNAQFSLSTTGKSRDLYELQDMYRRALAASWACQPGELPADECIEEIFSGGDGFGPEGPWGAGAGADPAVRMPGDATPRGHHHQHHKHHSSHHSLGRSTARSGMRGNGPSTTGGGGLSGGLGWAAAKDDEFLRPSDRRGLAGGQQQRRHMRHGSGESIMRGRGGEMGGHQPHGLRGGGHRRDGSKDSGRPPSAGLRGRSDSLSSLAATIESERGRSGFKSTREVDEYELREDMVAWALPGSVC